MRIFIKNLDKDIQTINAINIAIANLSSGKIWIFILFDYVETRILELLDCDCKKKIYVRCFPSDKGEKLKH